MPILISIICACNQDGITESKSYDPHIYNIINDLTLGDVDSLMYHEIGTSTHIVCNTINKLYSYDSLLLLYSINGKCVIMNYDIPIDTTNYDTLKFEYKLNNIVSYYNNGNITNVRFIGEYNEITPIEQRLLYPIKIQYYIDISINNLYNQLEYVSITYVDETLCNVLGMSTEFLDGFNFGKTITMK
jgi:hypothetical protein